MSILELDFEANRNGDRQGHMEILTDGSPEIKRLYLNAYLAWLDRIVQASSAEGSETHPDTSLVSENTS